MVPSGEELLIQGQLAFKSMDYFGDYDPELVEDISVTLNYLTYGLLSQFAAGRIDGDEMLRVYERVAARLTASQK